MKAESTGFADGFESGVKEDQGFGPDQRTCKEEEGGGGDECMCHAGVGRWTRNQEFVSENSEFEMLVRHPNRDLSGIWSGSALKT